MLAAQDKILVSCAMIDINSILYTNNHRLFALSLKKIVFNKLVVINLYYRDKLL